MTIYHNNVDDNSTLASSDEANLLLFELTIVTSNDIGINKSFTVNKEGKLVNGGAGNLSDGSFEVRSVHGVEGLSRTLATLANNQVLISGLPLDTNGNIIRSGTLLSETKYLSITNRNVGVVTRSKRTIDADGVVYGFFVASNLLLLDNDKVAETPQEMIDIYKKLIPELKDVAFAVRYSSSHGVGLVGQHVDNEKKSFHIYLITKSPEDHARIISIIKKRLWFAGHGRIDISQSGSLLVRQTLDVSASDHGRLIFEAEPWMGEGVEKNPDRSTDFFVNGTAFDSTSVPDLTAAEEAAYLGLIAKAKLEAKPDAEVIRGKYVFKAISDRVAMGCAVDVATRSVELSMTSNKLYPSHILYKNDYSLFTVADVFANPNAFDGLIFRDPFDYDYGVDKAKLFINTNKDTGEMSIVIHSFAHGEQNYFLESAIPSDVVPMVLSPSQTKLLLKISSTLAKSMNCDLTAVTDCIDKIVMVRMLKSTFWHPTKSKFIFISNNNLLQFSDSDIRRHLAMEFGVPYFSEAFTSLIDEYLAPKNITNITLREKLFTQLLQVPINSIINDIKHDNQKSRMSFRDDMFISESYMDIKTDRVDAVFKHEPHIFKARGVTDGARGEIIQDYKRHMPLLDEVLGFLVNARFAPDRKKAYLYIIAQSDWGKGFFSSALAKNRFTTELSLTELKSIFSGAPVGKSAEDFRGSIALVFNEFKTSNAELKQLESEVTASPKHELSFTTPVYSKLFFSAETNQSLAGEDGVEGQFANRFSLLQLTGNLTARDVFINRGSGLYHDVVSEYIGQYIEDGVQRMIGLGARDAEKLGQVELDAFHKRHGIGNTVKSLDDRMFEIAEEIRHLSPYATNGNHVNSPLDNYSLAFTNTLRKNTIKTCDGMIFLTKPVEVVKKFIETEVSYTSKGMIGYKAGDIAGLWGSVEQTNKKGSDGMTRNRRMVFMDFINYQDQRIVSEL